MFRIVGELLHPIAQLRHMHAQVLRSLHIGHASLLDQAHSLKFELAGKLPSLHDPPPAPSKHPNSVSSEPGAGQWSKSGAVPSTTLSRWSSAKERARVVTTSRCHEKCASG